MKNTEMVRSTFEALTISVLVSLVLTAGAIEKNTGTAVLLEVKHKTHDRVL